MDVNGLTENGNYLLKVIKKELLLYENYVSAGLIQNISLLEKELKDMPTSVKNQVAGLLEGLVEERRTYASIYIYSFLIGLLPESGLLERYISYISKNFSRFSGNTLYFLHSQITRLMFLNKDLENAATKQLSWQLLLDICQEFETKMHMDLNYIPIQERNPDLIIVITGQVLEIQHGPTKTAYDRCAAIIRYMKKNTLLINSAEMLSPVGSIPYLNPSFGNYNPALVQKENLEWKGCSIPYFQCEQNMPDTETMELILKYIKQLRPLCIVSIGGSSVLSYLANKMVSGVTISLNPSELTPTATKYQAIGKKLDTFDKEILENLGLKELHVIESVFTSDFRTQTDHFLRKDLSLPEDKFILLTVGGRLDSEIKEDFIAMLEDIFQENENIFIAFAGSFGSYNDYALKYKRFSSNSINLGFCKDIIAVAELCDLYVNPIRKGGGTSVQEAMIKGKPAVTVAYGDVATNTGEDFCVKDYEEMKPIVLKYAEDKEFYLKMSEKALERMEILTDTKTAFIDIIQEALKREGA